MPRRQRDPFRPSWIQLSLEQRCNDSEHYGHRGGFVYGNGFPKWVQQYFCSASGDGELGSSVDGVCFGSDDFLPRRQRDPVRPSRIQLSVEQRRHYAEHHPYNQWFLFSCGFGKRVQQYLVYANGHGKSFAAEYGYGFGCIDVLPRG